MHRLFCENSRIITVLLGVLLTIGAPFFFIGGPDWVSPPLYRALWSLGHILFFFLLFILIQMRHNLGGWRRWLLASAAVFVASVIIEYLQSLIGRQADWHDVLRNLIGTWLALFWWQRPSLLVWCGRLAASLLLIVQLQPAVRVLTMEYHIARQFPVLSNFDAPRDMRRWSGVLERSREYVSEGEYSLRITLREGRVYPGAHLRWLRSDWRGYRWLGFDIYNPDEQAFPLTLRINDRAHDRGAGTYTDRFNARLMVEPGWNTYRIDLAEVAAAPESRAMDMRQIQRLMLFVSRLEEPKVIYLDNLRLE